jgi:hypothetical protein
MDCSNVNMFWNCFYVIITYICELLDNHLFILYNIRFTWNWADIFQIVMLISTTPSLELSFKNSLGKV